MKAAPERSALDRSARTKQETSAGPESSFPQAVPATAGWAAAGLGNRALLALHRAGRLQAKSRVGAPGDPREREADRAAEAVVAGAAARPEREARRAPDLAPAHTPGQGDQLVAPLIEPLGRGERLDEAVRSHMETRFGESFEDVRVHTGHHAHEANETLRARAFTVGADIVFGEGQYAPGTTEGRRLLAHELAHVVQQRRSTGAFADNRETERDAHEAAARILEGGTPRVRERAAPGSVQRAPLTDVPAETGVGIWGLGQDSFDWPISVDGHEVWKAFQVPVTTQLKPRAWEDVDTKTLYVDPDTNGPSRQIGYGRWNQVLLTRGRPVIVTPTHPSPPPPQPSPQPKPAPAPKKPAPKPAPQPQPAPSSRFPEIPLPQVVPETVITPGETAPPEAGSRPVAEQVVTALESDPSTASQLAHQLSDADLKSLGSVDRARLLRALALHPQGDRLDVETVVRLLDQTPDDQVTALEDQLFAQDGVLLRLMSQEVRGNEDARKLIDGLMRLWKRGELPPGPDDGRPRWMKGLMGDPVKRTRTQYDQMLKDAPETLRRRLDRVRGSIVLDDHNRAWRNNPFGNLVDTWGGLQKPPTAAEIHFGPQWWYRDPYGAADYAGSLIEQGQFFEAGEQLRRAEALNQDLFREWQQYRAGAGGVIDSGEDLERKLVVVRNGSLVVLVVLAPEVVIPGMLIGGGMTAARQGVQIAEGSRREYSWDEIQEGAIMGGITAPIAMYVPGAAYGMTGLGAYGAVQEFRQGHYATAGFDAVTAFAPLAMKKAGSTPPGAFGRWARPRIAAGALRLGTAVSEVPGLGGRSFTPGLPSEPVPMLVLDAAGRPVGTYQPGTGTFAGFGSSPAASPGRTAGNWKTVNPSATPPSSPYQMPVVVRFVDPIDAAFAPDAAFSVGTPRGIARTRVTGSGRQITSLDDLPLTPAQRQAASRVHGKTLPPELQQAWQNTANAREQVDLAEVRRLVTAGQREEAAALARDVVFNNHRNRFWAAVRRDPALQKIFTDAGMVFPPGKGAPVYLDPVTGVRRDVMTLEHTQRLADNPTRSVDGTNLQLVLGDENSFFLEWLRANDPFQNPPPAPP